MTTAAATSTAAAGKKERKTFGGSDGGGRCGRERGGGWGPKNSFQSLFDASGNKNIGATNRIGQEIPCSVTEGMDTKIKEGKIHSVQ